MPRQPGRFEGGIGFFIGVLSLMVQGVFLVRALRHPDMHVLWVVWALVLGVVITFDVVVVRFVIRRRQ